MKKPLLYLIFLILLSCNSEKTNIDHKKIPTIYTTFYPTAYFTQRIAKDYIKVVCPVPENEDVIFWKAYKQPEIITQYQQADLIILNGAKLAKWVNKVSLPQEKIINTAKSFSKNFIYTEASSTHTHGATQHSHSGLDGHTWVDPVNAKIQAEEIKKALVKLLPKHKDKMEKNFKHLQNDLDQLIHTLEKYQHNKKKSYLLASHPAYNYIARRFKWNVKNLDLDPKTIPNQQTLAKIKNVLSLHPAKYILWESKPSQKTSQTLQRELGIKSIVFSPCELFFEKDYMETMKENLKNIEEIWK